MNTIKLTDSKDNIINHIDCYLSTCLKTEETKLHFRSTDKIQNIKLVDHTTLTFAIKTCGITRYYKPQIITENLKNIITKQDIFVQES